MPYTDECKALEKNLALDNCYNSESSGDIQPWTSVNLPKGWSYFFSGCKLKTTWYDQGSGNRKGRIYCKLGDGEYIGISTLAPHTPAYGDFMIPPSFFEKH